MNMYRFVLIIKFLLGKNTRRLININFALWNTLYIIYIVQQIIPPNYDKSQKFF